MPNTDHALLRDDVYVINHENRLFFFLIVFLSIEEKTILNKITCKYRHRTYLKVIDPNALSLYKMDRLLGSKNCVYAFFQTKLTL